MGKKKFVNPDNEKQFVEIEECKLDKKQDDFDSRSNRIPEVDELSLIHISEPTRR